MVFGVLFKKNPTTTLFVFSVSDRETRENMAVDSSNSGDSYTAGRLFHLVRRQDSGDQIKQPGRNWTALTA